MTRALFAVAAVTLACDGGEPGTSASLDGQGAAGQGPGPTSSQPASGVPSGPVSQTPTTPVPGPAGGAGSAPGPNPEQPDAQGGSAQGGSGGTPGEPPPQPDPATAGSGGTTDAPAAGGAGIGAAGGAGTESGGAGAMAQGGSAGSPPVLEGTPTHEERALLPTVRQEHSAAALGGEVYVIGGFTPSVSASLQAYSPEGDEWREVADFPEALHHANAAVVGDTLYVLGFNRGGSFTDIDGRVFAYDPGTNQWTGRTSMPTGTERASSCVAALGTEIYVFGGSVNTAGNSTTVVDSSVYDTVADEWEDLPPMPEAREHCLAGAVGGMLYIVSGRSGGIAGLEPESWAFDPEARQFEERAPIPTPRGGAAGAVLGGRIYVFGGEGNDADSEGVFHEVEAYDPSTDQWEELPDMLIARHGYAAAAVGDRIYLPGGAINEGFGANDAHTVFFLE